MLPQLSFFLARRRMSRPKSDDANAPRVLNDVIFSAELAVIYRRLTDIITDQWLLIMI
jgi:hypothetical protein